MHIDNHPAVKKHLQEIGKVWDQYSTIPNHNQLVPYLIQLPVNSKYVILNPVVGGVLENGSVIPDESCYKLFGDWQRIGIKVDFVKGDEYGYCWMVKHKTSLKDKFGLMVSYNEFNGSVNNFHYLIFESD